MRLSLLAAFFIVSLSAKLYAQDPFVETNSLGTTDWVEGYIEATGQGTSRYMGNRVQEEVMAKQAARTAAQTHLLEIIKGVRITGLTTLSAHAQSDTRAASRIKGTLRGARVLNEKVTWHKDNSARRGEVVMAEVTMRVCVNPACKDTKTNLTQASLTLPDRLSSDLGPKFSGYSSVIIDLEQALYLPALAPEIINENDELVYSQDTVDQTSDQVQGLVHYSKSVQQAKELEVSGKNPLILKIKEITPDNRIVLFNTDTSALKDLQALKLGYVIVALD